jgi:cytochrome c oxidase subunit 2
MDPLEKKVIFASIGLMIVFAFLVLYAGYGMGIALPSHEQHVAPFTEEQITDKGDNRFEVHYVAKMWAFEPAELVLPANADVELYVSAVDVNHGFQVLGTNVNLMAVPGTVNSARHRFTRPGDYMVVCHEYCGLNHQKMFGKIRIVSPAEYTRYQQEMAGRLAAGEKLAANYECTSCHSIDGTEGIGPTFKGLYGRKSILADGTEVMVDEKYIIDSVRNPDLHIVKGYDPGSMPSTDIPENELNEIIAYLETLK